MKGFIPSYPTVGIAFRRESIPTSMMSPNRVPDPAWRYVDKKGHGHFWDGKKLPTLKKVKVGEQWIGDEIDGDVYPIHEYRCRICDETVAPARKDEHVPTSIPGPTMVTVTIDKEEWTCSMEEYEKSLEAWAAHLREHVPRNWIEFDKT